MKEMEEMASQFLPVNEKGELESKRRRDWKILLLILTIAFGLRIFLVINPEVIHNDGTEYVRHAKQILSGDWTGEKIPPLYPSLIALAYFFTKNYEMAGIWISVIFGTLLVLPVFYLGKEIFNEKVGAISALFAAVHPFLYMSSGSVLTESTYHFFLATSTLFGWNAFSKGRFYNILLFSLFTTLAYLTRPEAIGFLLIFCFWVLLKNPPIGKRPWIKRIGTISIAIIAFLVFSSPYLIQIRKETGKWGISKKASVSIGSLSEEEETPSIETIRKKKIITLSSLVKNPLPVLGKIGIGVLGSLSKFQQVYNPILFLLAVMGWIFLFKKKNLYPLKGSFFLISYLIFFFGLVFPFFFVTRRYSSQMISISIPWAAFGFLGFVSWVHQRLRWGVSQKRFAAILLMIILIGLFIQGRVIHTRGHRFIQREVGFWMKDHLPDGAIIMSSMPQEAFYAELPWVRMPQGRYEEILREAHAKGVQYLVIDEKTEKDSPNFLEKSKEGNLIPLLDLNKKDRRMVVFEIVYPQGK